MPLQPLIHPLRNLNIIFLHKKHMSVPLNPLFPQVRILNIIHTRLLQILHRTVIIRRMKRRFTCHNELRYLSYVGQLLGGLGLHDAVLVIGVDGGFDGCSDERGVHACGWRIFDWQVRQAECEGWVCAEWWTHCEGWARGIELNKPLDQIGAFVGDLPGWFIVSSSHPIYLFFRPTDLI
jgi:hypothetical protein